MADPETVLTAIKTTGERVWWMFTNPLFWLLPVAAIWLARRAAREHDAAERERNLERIRKR